MFLLFRDADSKMFRFVASSSSVCESFSSRYFNAIS